MINTIKKIAAGAVDSGSPLEIKEAVVVSPPPNLQIKLKDNDKLIIPNELIIVSEHLTRHLRVASVSSANIIDTMTTNGQGPHTHDILTLDLNESTIEFTDELKDGDQVMVAVVQGGQSFFIMDRFISYEG